MTEVSRFEFAYYSYQIHGINIILDGGCTFVTHCRESKESELADFRTVLE